MSGNPFRASLLHTQPTAAPIPPTSFIHTDTDSSRPETDPHERWDGDPVLSDASPPLQKIKKSVRIESPTEPYSPHPIVRHDAEDSLAHHLNQNKHAGSPPLVSPAGFSDNFEDTHPDASQIKSLGKGGMDVRDTPASSWTNSGVSEPSPASPGVPVNPFARTLATMELQEKGSGEHAQNAGHNNRDRTGAERVNVRASLDVEGFKNLLMTGITSPRQSGPPQHPPTAPNTLSAPIFESGSSTDTSSVSRQSIFEPVQESHPETPRTSYEMPASEDDERMGLATEVKKEKKKPPPAPKHRHGKLVTSRQPQIVSFSDFAATEATSSPVLRARTNSDLNKPLPATPPVPSPPVHIATQDITQDQLPPLETKASESSLQSSTQLDAPQPQKRAPPPVPIARRQSQLRTSTMSSRARSNSSLTVSSQNSADLTISTSGPTSDPSSPPSALKSPPPPPPSRRHRAELAGLNTSSAHSSTTELLSTSTSRRSNVPSPSAPRTAGSAVEPPSPVAVRRSPSISSTRNTVYATTSDSIGPTMAPPPPPPRRRQSNRSSLDQQRPYPIPTSSPNESRRTSTENKRNSYDSKRRTSVNSESSLRYEYAPTEDKGNEYALYSPQEEHEKKKLDGGAGASETELEQANASSSNILDDMEKFQREIDELRQKYKK